MAQTLFTSVDRMNTDSIKWRVYPPDVLPLWVADMDFTSPPEVIEALKKRVEHGVFGYGDESLKLLELVVERMERLYGWKIKVEDILLTPGVITGFNLTCQAVTNPGDSIVIQPPIYPPFFGVAGIAGVNQIQCPLENDGTGDYTLNLSTLESALGKSKFLLFCNPHNPIGKVYLQRELEKIAEACLRNDVFICSDEIHSDLVFSESRHIPIASLNKEIGQKVVTLIAPSKTYNIAGLDCAILICENAELMKHIKQARRGIMGGVNLLGNTAAIAAYRYGQPWLEEILHYLQENRDYLSDYIRKYIPKIKIHSPGATYLAWLDCTGLVLEVEAHDFFLKNAKVALNRGFDFGGDGRGFVRLNFGCDRATLTLALERMKNSLK